MSRYTVRTTSTEATPFAEEEQPWYTTVVPSPALQGALSPFGGIPFQELSDPRIQEEDFPHPRSKS